MRLAERAAEHGEILGEGEDGAAVDRAPAGDHAVARNSGLLHAELGRAVLDEHVELLERALVHEQLEALAGGELAALVLGFDARIAAAFARPPAAFFELFEDVLHAQPARTWIVKRKMHTTPRSMPEGGALPAWALLSRFTAPNFRGKLLG